jgi:RNA polymerase sigma-70 factor, ECF subfamily
LQKWLQYPGAKQIIATFIALRLFSIMRRESMNQDQEDLLAQLTVDLDHSFEILVESYWQQLYVFALRRTASPQDAEDIVSEALVRAYIALKGYPVERMRALKLRSWLYKITYNEYCRHVSRSIRLELSFAQVEEGMALEKDEDLSKQPEMFFESAERRLELEGMVAALPGQYREAVSLYYFEEFSYQEIADLLDQPLGTVKSNVHRGVRLLRKVMSARSNEVY